MPKKQTQIPLSQITPELAAQILREQTEFLVDNDQLGPVSRSRFLAVEASIQCLVNHCATNAMLADRVATLEAENTALKTAANESSECSAAQE